MALNDLQLEAVVNDNPPAKTPGHYQKGTKYSDYLDLLVTELGKRHPTEKSYLQTRKDDAARRLGVVIKKKYPLYKTDDDKAHYHVKAQQAAMFEKLPKHLKQSYTNKQQPDVRKQVAKEMGIIDKGHATHGANFTAPQTLKQIIDNLFATVSKPQQPLVAAKIQKKYGYDPR